MSNLNHVFDTEVDKIYNEIEHTQNYEGYEDNVENNLDRLHNMESINEERDVGTKDTRQTTLKKYKMRLYKKYKSKIHEKKTYQKLRRRQASGLLENQEDIFIFKHTTVRRISFYENETAKIIATVMMRIEQK